MLLLNLKQLVHLNLKPLQEKNPVSNNRISPSSPQIRNTGTISQLSLLNKVDMDSTIAEKNSVQRSSSEKYTDDTSPTIKSASTTSQDVTLKLNQTITKTVTSTPEPTIPQNDQLIMMMI